MHKSSGAVAIIASLIAACGGGGGGGSAPPPPPPPPPPPETIPLALTSANYSLAAELTVDVAEAVLQFAQLASDAADQLQANLQNPGTIACPNGGTLELTFTDSNADGVLNSGDSIQASYHDCYQSSVNDVINGDLTLKVGEAAATMSMDAAPSYAFELQFPAPFTVGSTGSASTVSGSLAVGILRDSLTTTLGAASTAADDLNIAVVANGKNYSEAPRSLVLHKKLDYSAATYELRLAMVYRSQALGGQVALATRDYVGGYFNTYPIIGLFDLAGAAPNTVELRVGGQYVIPGNEQSTAELSTDGFQTIESSQITPWGELYRRIFVVGASQLSRRLSQRLCAPIHGHHHPAARAAIHAAGQPRDPAREFADLFPVQRSRLAIIGAGRDAFTNRSGGPRHTHQPLF